MSTEQTTGEIKATRDVEDCLNVGTTVVGPLTVDASDPGGNRRYGDVGLQVRNPTATLMIEDR